MDPVKRSKDEAGKDSWGVRRMWGDIEVAVKFFLKYRGGDMHVWVEGNGHVQEVDLEQ